MARNSTLQALARVARNAPVGPTPGTRTALCEPMQCRVQRRGGLDAPTWLVDSVMSWKTLSGRSRAREAV